MNIELFTTPLSLVNNNDLVLYKPLFGQLAAHRGRETKIEHKKQSHTVFIRARLAVSFTLLAKFRAVSPFLADIQGRSRSFFGVGGDG